MGDTHGGDAHTTTNPVDGNMIVYFTDPGSNVVRNSTIELYGVADASTIHIVNATANDWQVMGVA
jgi:hypothetical protein